MIRKFIRERVQEVLKAAKIPEVNQDVFCRKSTQHDDGGLPIICIYPNTETVSRFDEAPKRYKRFYDVTIEAISTHETDQDLCDELDMLSYAIESAIESDDVLQGILPYDKQSNLCFEDTELTSVNYDMQSDGSSPIGLVRLTYSVSYIDRPFTRKIYNSFDKLESKWEIGNHGDNQAIDNLDIPQE